MDIEKIVGKDGCVEQIRKNVCLITFIRPRNLKRTYDEKEFIEMCSDWYTDMLVYARFPGCPKGKWFMPSWGKKVGIWKYIDGYISPFLAYLMKGAYNRHSVDEMKKEIDVVHFHKEDIDVLFDITETLRLMLEHEDTKFLQTMGYKGKVRAWEGWRDRVVCTGDGLKRYYDMYLTEINHLKEIGVLPDKFDE